VAGDQRGRGQPGCQRGGGVGFILRRVRSWLGAWRRWIGRCVRLGTRLRRLPHLRGETLRRGNPRIRVGAVVRVAVSGCVACRAFWRRWTDRCLRTGPGCDDCRTCAGRRSGAAIPASGSVRWFGLRFRGALLVVLFGVAGLTGACGRDPAAAIAAPARGDAPARQSPHPGRRGGLGCGFGVRCLSCFFASLDWPVLADGTRLRRLPRLRGETLRRGNPRIRVGAVVWVAASGCVGLGAALIWRGSVVLADFFVRNGFGFGFGLSDPLEQGRVCGDVLRVGLGAAGQVPAVGAAAHDHRGVHGIRDAE
jgi:hypothetical protein